MGGVEWISKLKVCCLVPSYFHMLLSIFSTLCVLCSIAQQAAQ
jgi:hypothetical protein